MKSVIAIILLTTSLAVRADYLNIIDFGAREGVQYNSTQAVQAAIDSASESGDQVYFPSGAFYTGTVYLRDHTTIYLEQGAFWKGVHDSTQYHYIPPRVKTRMDLVPFKSFIYAYNKTGIKIYGDGTIHPSGELDFFVQHGKSEMPKRPYGLQLVECTDILIEGITLTNAAFWMIRCLNCTDVNIHGITIFNHCNLNNDGIDIDGCHNVKITECTVDSSDDAICIKSEGTRTSEDVIVSDCIISSFATAFKLGTASIGGFRRISFSNCIIRPSEATVNHHQKQLWGGMAGIDLLCVDGGVLEDVLISNIHIKGVETPLFIKLGNRNSRGYRLGERTKSAWERAPEVSGGPGIVRRIIIQQIISTDTGPICSIIDGLENTPVEKVLIKDSYFEISRPGTVEDITKPASEKPSNYPSNRMYRQNMPAYGFFIRHAQEIELRNIAFEIPDSEPRPAIVCENVSSSVLKEITGALHTKNLELITTSNCSDLTMEDCKVKIQ